MKSLSSLSLLGLLAVLCSCAVSRGSEIDPDQILRRRSQQLAVQAASEAAFARDNPVPQERQIEGQGTLTVRRVELAGLLGRELVKVQFTYRNTTGRAVRKGWVILSVRDPATGEVHSVVESMFLPFPLSSGPDSSYTAAMSVPTQGLHMAPGWEWDITVEVEHLAR